MRIGICIPVYNRPNYIAQCLQSLESVKTNEVCEICLVNDGSSDKEIKTLLESFRPNWAKVSILHQPSNKGVSKSLFLGLSFLSRTCDYLIVLDSDAIVKPNFIEVLLDLKLRFGKNIVSGFNTLSKDPSTGNPRHPILNTGKDFHSKRTIGGINMIFSKDQYKAFVMPSLINTGHWDWLLCNRFPNGFIVSKPSVVQHIGIEAGLHISNNPDIATDYDE